MCMQDIDVELPTMDDFPTQHNDNHLFIERTKLCVLLGQLADARRKPQMADIGLEAIGESLRRWPDQLHRELRLHDPAKGKCSRRVTSELHITYYIAMILYLQSVAKTNSTQRSTRSILKECSEYASRTICLFEESLYRNDVLYLAPINNWFVFLAGVIQIRSRATLVEKRDTCTAEVNIVKTVLKQLADVVPSSAFILCSFERMESSSRMMPAGAVSLAEGLSSSENLSDHKTEQQKDVRPSSGPGIYAPSQNDEPLKCGLPMSSDYSLVDGMWDSFDFDRIQFDAYVPEEWPVWSRS
ncbi:hypothetical protein Plec18167_003869 [Paecilomyces lecythidis]|uniref:Transcription factor domain-containing protein n=1 Tax=Paecilomyces lecythidis TaxID=3004212 RepID=A0ABR3XWS7_9EURO